MKKIRELTDKYNTLIFVISIIVISLVLITRDKCICNECPICDEIITSYKYNINYNGNDTLVILNVIKDNNKYTITINDDVYYIYYTDVYKVIDNEEILFNDNIITNVDNKLLILDFILDLKDDKCITYLNNNICYEDNIIKLSNDEYQLTYEIDSK